MKVSLIAVLLVAAFASEAEGFFGPFGPFGLRRFGMFGFRRFGLGFGLGFRRFGLFGKRSVENMTAIAEPTTICDLRTKDLMMSCAGADYDFKCEVENRLNIENLEEKMETFRILPADFNRMTNETINETVLLSFRPKDEMKFNNFSMTHESEELTFKIYNDEAKEAQGFRVTEKSCWDKFEKMMNDEEQVEMKLRIQL